MPKTLICCVGLPRSGKTTWARTQGFPIVCPDAIRLALHGQRFIGLAEPFVWAIAKLMVRALFLAGHDIVILDATNTTRERRNEWRSDDWQVQFKFIDTSREICLERARAEGDDYIVEHINRMADQFEPLERTLVYLWHDNEGHPSVMVTDYPNAETTVGAIEMSWFYEDAGWGWPSDAVAYAESMGAANRCPVEYEPWSMRDFGAEDTENED